MESKRGVKRPRSAEAIEGESNAKVSKTENKASKEDSLAKVIVQFKSTEGEATGPQIEIAPDVTTEQLHDLINNLLKNEEKLPYSFFVNDDEIVSSLKELLDKQKASPEDIVPILYQPQAVFRVRAVTRCTATIPGHSAPVLHVSFSPDGSSLASGSGDATVRIWDVLTETPKHTLEGHASDVLAVAWAPNCKLLASGSKDGEVRVWDVNTGKRKTILKGHKKWVTSLAWEPYLSNPGCSRLASASKDGTVRIWDIVRGVCLMTLSGHTASVTQVKWGGVNLLYSASQDRSIKVWETGQGKLVRTLDGHAHWVNSIALSTDYALRTGPYDEKGGCPKDEKEILKAAQDKYNKALEATARKGSDGKSVSGELLASGSEDFTLHLWDPTRDKKPVTRMTGHQQPINYICYSPDGRSIASGSFDKSVRLWNGSTGRFVTRFVAHVGAVYQLAWSADSRMLVSGSKDSTMKLWEIRTKKLAVDLPGHADEVYAVDWSPDGERVASGGKDKVLKIWRK